MGTPILVFVKHLSFTGDQFSFMGVQVSIKWVQVGRYLRELRMPPLAMQEEGLTKGTSCPSHCPRSGAS